MSFHMNGVAFLLNSIFWDLINTFHILASYICFQISFIESWFLSLTPIKSLLLRMLKKPKRQESDGLLKREIAYAFGDHYYFRKELKILNLLTGYQSFLHFHVSYNLGL